MNDVEECTYQKIIEDDLPIRPTLPCAEATLSNSKPKAAQINLPIFLSHLSRVSENSLRQTVEGSLPLFAARPDILLDALQGLSWSRAIVLYDIVRRCNLFHAQKQVFHSKRRKASRLKQDSSSDLLPNSFHIPIEVEHTTEYIRALCYSDLWKEAMNHLSSSFTDQEYWDCTAMCFSHALMWDRALRTVIRSPECAVLHTAPESEVNDVEPSLTHQTVLWMQQVCESTGRGNAHLSSPPRVMSSPLLISLFPSILHVLYEKGRIQELYTLWAQTNFKPFLHEVAHREGGSYRYLQYIHLMVQRSSSFPESNTKVGMLSEAAHVCESHMTWQMACRTVQEHIYELIGSAAETMIAPNTKENTMEKLRCTSSVVLSSLLHIFHHPDHCNTNSGPVRWWEALRALNFFDSAENIRKQKTVSSIVNESMETTKSKNKLYPRIHLVHTPTLRALYALHSLPRGSCLVRPISAQNLTKVASTHSTAPQQIMLDILSHAIRRRGYRFALPLRTVVERYCFFRQG